MTSPDPLIRPIEPADFTDVARLTLAAYAATGQLAGGHGYDKVLADVGSRVRHGDVLVAADAVTGQVLGSVLFVLPGSEYAEVSSGDEAEFRTLAVDISVQRRGVGRALVQACIDRASALGRSALVICTRDFAAGAHQLYESFGFERFPARDWSPAPEVRLLALRLSLPVRIGQAG